MAAEVWTGFLFRMRFVGVSLEFLQSRETDAVGSLTRSLARFDIQDSEFSFESRSNQCKTVDFTNHAVIGYDTRYEGENNVDRRIMLKMQNREGKPALPCSMSG